MTDDGLRGLLREMREQPLPADSLARVRMRVAQGVQRRRRWKIGAFVLAPVCALAIALALRSPAPPQLRLPGLPPVRVEPAVMRTEPPPGVRRNAVRRKPVARRPAEPPVLIRIETPDPDVVILLVGN